MRRNRPAVTASRWHWHRSERDRLTAKTMGVPALYPPCEHLPTDVLLPKNSKNSMGRSCFGSILVHRASY